jgi:hypothetical protein
MNVEAVSSETPLNPIADAPLSAKIDSVSVSEQSLLSAMDGILPGISPTASFLSRLDTLQQTDPEGFSTVADNMTQLLHMDAKTAALDGNLTQADTLNQVAEVFQASVESGQLPTIDDLHAAGVSSDHFYGHETAAELLNAPIAIASPASDSIESIIASDVTTAIDLLNT